MWQSNWKSRAKNILIQKHTCIPNTAKLQLTLDESLEGFSSSSLFLFNKPSERLEDRAGSITYLSVTAHRGRASRLTN